VVVDLKSARVPPSNKAALEHRQLALYQYAVDRGAVTELVGAEVRSGGAELVQLGKPDDSVDAQVQPQPVHPDDGPERAGLRIELARAASHLRSETFPATPGAWCKDCAFLSVCPAKSAGPVL
jgi:hypothetical protein